MEGAKVRRVGREAVDGEIWYSGRGLSKDGVDRVIVKGE